MSSPQSHPTHLLPRSRPASYLLSRPSTPSQFHLTPSRPASPILQAPMHLTPSSLSAPAESTISVEPSEADSSSMLDLEGIGLATEPSPEASPPSGSPSSHSLQDHLPAVSDQGPDSSQALRDQLRRTLSNRSGSVPPSPPYQRKRHIAEGLEDDSASLQFSPLSDSEAQRYEDRKYFVLTDAGKPVFISDKGEQYDEASNSMGVIQALISVFADDGDKIRFINAGSTRITFLLRPPLYYVCVSSWGEPSSITKTHLEYLHFQILSTLTQPQLTKLFQGRGNFDLGRLLSGAEPLLRSLLSNAELSMETALSALQSLRMEPTKRKKVGEAMLPVSKMKDMLYALLIAKGRLITLLRPRKHSIHPSDLHILLNTVSSPSLLSPDSESWLPICLPRFNPNGFLYAYVGSPREGVGLVGVCVDREAWDEVREWSTSVNKRFEEEALLGPIEQAVVTHAYSAAELGIAGLRHFVYKSRTNVQFTQPEFDVPYGSKLEQRRLITLYQQVHDAIHARSGQAETLTLQYIKTDREAIMGWITTPFELYVSLSPQLSKPACVSAANAVVAWVKKEEGRLFLRDAPVF